MSTCEKRERTRPKGCHARFWKGKVRTSSRVLAPLVYVVVASVVVTSL